MCSSDLKVSPFFQKVSAPVCTLHPARDFVREGHLRHFVWKVGGLGCPVLEAGTKSVDCRGEAEALLQYVEKGVGGKPLPFDLVWEDELGFG